MMLEITNDANNVGVIQGRANRITAALNFVGDVMDTGIAAFESMTGQKRGSPGIVFYYDPTSTRGGFLDAHSVMNINEYYLDKYPEYHKLLQKIILHELWHYFKSKSDVKEDESTLKSYSACYKGAFVKALDRALEEGAADFFAYVVSRDELSDNDSGRQVTYDLLSGWDNGYYVNGAIRSEIIYHLLAAIPETSHDAFLRGRSGRSFKAFDKYINSFREAKDEERRSNLKERISPDLWEYQFGDLLLALIYVNHEFDSSITIRKLFNSTNAEIFAHLVESIRNDERKNGPIGTTLHSLIRLVECENCAAEPSMQEMQCFMHEFSRLGDAVIEMLFDNAEWYQHNNAAELCAAELCEAVQLRKDVAELKLAVESLEQSVDGPQPSMMPELLEELR